MIKGYTLLQLVSMKHTDDLYHEMEEDKISMWKQGNFMEPTLIFFTRMIKGHGLMKVKNL